MIGILNKRRNSKRGWIRIVEAFIALLLITGTLLVVINRGYIGGSDISPQVYQVQIAILREIELNSDYRTAILNANVSTKPIEWERFEDNGLEKIKDKINQTIPDYLECIGRLCELDDICSMPIYKEENVYAQSVAITAEKGVYSPRQLKLFCWSAG